MKIRALVPEERSNASVWWRIARPLIMLRGRGHNATWHIHDDPDTNEVDYEDALIIVHRIIPDNPEEYIRYLRSRGAAAIIYSLDDNVIDENALAEYLIDCGGLTSFAIQRILDRIPKQLEMMLLCDRILVTTEDLAEIVSEKTEGEVQILVLPNGIDENWYLDALDQKPPHVGNGALVHIGWASGRRPDTDLLDMAKAWRQIDKMYENVRFVVAGWQPDILDKHITLEKKIRIPYKTIEEWPTSMQVDIGCCTIADTSFNRGKSPIKYYEYSLAGAVVVATPFYSNVIVHGLNGVVVRNEEDWVKHLANLIELKNVRSRMVDAANYNIHNYSSLEATISDWEVTFQDILE